MWCLQMNDCRIEAVVEAFVERTAALVESCVDSKVQTSCTCRHLLGMDRSWSLFLAMRVSEMPLGPTVCWTRQEDPLQRRVDCEWNAIQVMVRLYLSISGSKGLSSSFNGVGRQERLSWSDKGAADLHRAVVYLLRQHSTSVVLHQLLFGIPILICFSF